MKRRQVLVGFAALGVAISAASRSFAQRKIPVVGTLDGGERLSWWAAFRTQLRELGYVEGKNLVLEQRFARGRFERLAGFAEELVRIPVDVIVTASTVAALAAKRATDTIPIVMATGTDHVSYGFAASLAKPGGNVTGMSSAASELTGKRFELLRELHPKLTRLAVLWQRDNLGSTTAIRELESIARTAKVSLQNLGVRKGGDDLAAAFSATVDGRAQALYVVLSPLTYAERQNIAALAIKYRLPTVHGAVEFVEAGGLASYGPDYAGFFRRAAVYVDKILKGTNPGDLPIEAPNKFDLVLNVKTAKLIGLAIPNTVLVRAARVID